MRRFFPILFIIVIPSLLSAQLIVKNEGTVVNNLLTGTWQGVNIPRAVPTKLSYINNSITSINAAGYLLQAGDEVPLNTNTNLNGAVITGNKFTWNGTDPASITHGLFTGYNINYSIKYNYLDKTPYGILFKSGTDAGTNMSYSSGYGAAYNIVKNAKLSLRMKGINGIQVYNNTFYSSQKTGMIILIDANHDRKVPAPSTGAKIKNNIFYTVYRIANISVERGCLANFESDYNIFYCESGTPMFSVDGVQKTFAQWQAMGYDLHSRVINPDFTDTYSFVPRARLNYATDLGTTWQAGLATTASWSPGSAPATALQNGLWQNGAVIYSEPVIADSTVAVIPPEPLYTGSVIEGSTPSLVEVKYSLALSAVSPPVTAFTATVNSMVRNITSAAVSGSTVQLTLSDPVVYGDAVTVAYTRPDINPVQTPAGGIAASFGPQQVTNKAGLPNSPPAITISSLPDNLSGFVSEIDASSSSDPDKDNVTFAWSVPGNIPVASTTDPVLRFLCPVVSVPTAYTFTLSVSDGKATTSAAIPLVIMPYKPELQSAVVEGIDASGYQSPYEPSNVLDGNTSTMWSANGDEQWLTLELRDPFNIQYLRIAFDPAQKRQFYFDILASEDKVNWEPVLIKSASCPFAGDPQVFDFPPSKSGIEFRYVKLVGHSNSVDSRNCVSDFRIMGLMGRRNDAYLNDIIELYPNPARNFLNVHLANMSVMPEWIKIVDLSGRLMFRQKFDPEMLDYQIPIRLRQGIYVVQIESGGSLIFTQKLIIEV